MNEERYREQPGSTSGGRDEGRSGGTQRDDELATAIRRFEQAVEGLATSARDRFGGRATRFIEEATARIEREAGRQTRREERRNRRRRPRSGLSEVYLDDASDRLDDAVPGEGFARGGVAGRPRGSRLFRNRYRRKIAGVCSGLASYLGLQTWVVRGAAITGALFFPMIVIPAYLIAMVALPETPVMQAVSGGLEGASRPVGGGEGTTIPVGNVRRDFRDTQSLLSQAELRLRRMEAHVTSDRFELQRELHRLEQGGTNGGASV